jgi:hypothetical protein
MKCLDANAIIAALNHRPAGERGWLSQELAGGERAAHRHPTVARSEEV